MRYSLEAAKSALSNVSAGIYDASAGMMEAMFSAIEMQTCSNHSSYIVFASVSSRRARSFAEDAFYHPSMMSVSYYSFEHCFAVYSVRSHFT